MKKRPAIYYICLLALSLFKNTLGNSEHVKRTSRVYKCPEYLHRSRWWRLNTASFRPYWTDTAAKQSAANEIKWIFAEKSTESSTTVGVAPIIPILKMNDSFHFFVNYWELSVINVDGQYPQPNTDECIQSLRKATLFITLDASSEH